MVDIVYAASNPHIGVAPADSRELADLLAMEHCAACGKYFLRVDFRVHVASKHRD
ncbi:hypothetical protein AURDEDRAFT_115496 [Auricularia subglabra TFB-10046 SS5]|uniref:C2H2-type domain-containing protein n=1 Tax=Auricularia subglabra (strain TFB-10046 / SS5) TaxID=717982 RepID=J0WXF1_AURST|nr:hypothetical protein AURDEDRAFT_115496 [Auricularia subglabra TFB-10046 SS5]